MCLGSVGPAPIDLARTVAEVRVWGNVIVTRPDVSHPPHLARTIAQPPRAALSRLVPTQTRSGGPPRAAHRIDR